MSFVEATLDISLEAAPWLLLGLVAAGLVKAWMPESALPRWLGGKGFGPIARAALIGAPLPLCSCGVLPVAAELRREGASKGATVSFLVATPETGPDSVALSYALLGPFMAVVRPVAAVFSALAAGLLVQVLCPPDPERRKPIVAPVAVGGMGVACCPTCIGESEPIPARPPGLKYGLAYAFTDLFGDLAHWLLLGILVAGAMQAFLPPQSLAPLGTGLVGMLAMMAAGIPVYVCATASTPIAAGLMMAGVSPGAALVFMLTGPATNLATLAVVRRDLGNRALAGYLGGIAAGALVAGAIADALAGAVGLDIPTQLAAAGEVMPPVVERVSGAVLAFFLLRVLVPRLGKKFRPV